MIGAIPLALAILIFYLFPLVATVILGVCGWDKLGWNTIAAIAVAFVGLALALDPRVGHLTITAVSLLEDLSSARIWFLPFGTSRDVDEQLAGLRSAAGFLRGELARQLGLRHAPRLEFFVDTNLEQAQALTQLINSAVANDRRLEEGAVPGAESAPESTDGQ